MRGRVLALITGLVALIAVYYTGRNADTARQTYKIGQENLKIVQETFRLSEQGHVTDRYTKAIEQLGSDAMAVRLGGIYALERIASDSARDHSTVMEVLCAFVRTWPERTAADTQLSATSEPEEGTEEENEPYQPVPADVQAACTVIGRRNYDRDTRQIDLSGANLTDADLSDAYLVRAILNEAQFVGAHLEGARLEGALLTNADLTGANLTRVNFTEASLFQAKLIGADLTGVNFTRADLAWANFEASHTRVKSTVLDRSDIYDLDRNLSGVIFTDADLTGTRGLPEPIKARYSKPTAEPSDSQPSPERRLPLSERPAGTSAPTDTPS